MAPTNQHPQQKRSPDQHLLHRTFEDQPDTALALLRLAQEIEDHSTNTQDGPSRFPARFELELTDPLRVALIDLSARLPDLDDHELLQLVIAKGVVAALQIAPRTD